MKKLLLPLAIGLVVAACSGNSSSSKQVKVVEGNVAVSGRVGSAIQNARTSATPINSEGGPTLVTNDSGDVVFEGSAARTDEWGDYSLTIEDEGDVSAARIFIAADDYGTVQYLCELPAGCSGAAYLSYVDFPEGVDIRAGVGELNSGMVVNVNWITDLATALAKTVYVDFDTNGLSADDKADIDAAVLADLETAKTGVYNEYTMELANLHVSALFAISDIIYVTPIGPSQITKPTNLGADRLQESIYYGALVSALPVLAAEQNTDYMTLLALISESAIERKGQLLQKNEDGNEVALADLYTVAINMLSQNIDRYQAQGARIPSAASNALNELNEVLNSFVDGQETNVSVDVPAELAGWNSAIGEAKEFLVDLTEAIKNFWAYDADKASFIDYDHARRMDNYYLAHEALYRDIAPQLSGPGSVLDDMMAAAEVLIACQYGAGDCSPADGRFVISSGTEESGGKDSDRVTIDGTLTLIMKQVNDSADDSVTTFNQFDFEIDETKNSLTKGVDGLSTKYVWEGDLISDSSTFSQPYLRLYYDERYTSPPSLDAVEPEQIAVIWPLIRFDQNIVSDDPGGELHTFNILFEANLIGVRDPLNESSELRYNPVTTVFWLLPSQYSVDEVEVSEEYPAGIKINQLNVTRFLSQMRSYNALGYYPEQKWPAFNEFFKSRSDAPEVITNMVVSLYRGTETINGVVVDVFDSEVVGNDSINRIRVYPYDSGLGSTRTQPCSVSIVDSARVVDECDDSLYLAGDVSLDDLIESNYETGELTSYKIIGNGTYTIDLRSSGFVDAEGNYTGMAIGDTYGPFDGQFESPVQLGISTLTVSASSELLDTDGAYIPTAAELIMSREVDDIYSFSLAYTYGADEDYEVISEAIGVDVGANAQAFVLEYAVSEEELLNEDDEFYTMEIERGAWTAYRSGVTLGGDKQSVLSHIVTRTEYPQGDADTGCGLNDRDKLSSGGDCDAVAYLTVRGSLVGTIREERDGVFVARFVDGTWMIIGD